MKSTVEINKGNWTGEKAIIHYNRIDANHISFHSKALDGDYIVRVEPADGDADGTYNFWVWNPIKKGEPLHTDKFSESIVCGFYNVKTGKDAYKSRDAAVAWNRGGMEVEREVAAEIFPTDRVKVIVTAAAQVLFNI